MRLGMVYVPRGEEKVEAKLDDEKVRWIREMRAGRTLSCKKMAALFEVAVSTVEKAAWGMTWTHVK